MKNIKNGSSSILSASSPHACPRKSMITPLEAQFQSVDNLKTDQNISPIEKNGLENGYDQQQQTLIPLGEVSIMNIIHFIKARKPKYPTKLKSHSLGKVRKFKIIHMLQSPIWLRYDSWLTISTEEFNYYLVAVCLLCSD